MPRPGVPEHQRAGCPPGSRRRSGRVRVGSARPCAFVHCLCNRPARGGLKKVRLSVGAFLRRSAEDRPGRKATSGYFSPATLPAITPREWNGEPVQTVDGEEWHAWLGVGTRFDTWISRKIEAYGFVEGRDYLTLKSEHQVPHQGGLRTITKTTYYLTIDMAKELSMVERNEKGKAAPLGFCSRSTALFLKKQLWRSEITRKPGFEPLSNVGFPGRTRVCVGSADVDECQRARGMACPVR
jgi:phage anti-repressor protein